MHHESRNPSPWAAYAFAPAEALVHAAFVPLILLVMPAHTIALAVFLGVMIARNVLGHLGLSTSRQSAQQLVGVTRLGSA